MSRDTFQLLQTMDVRQIELQLSLQCAPVLSGLKASNLFVVSRKASGDVLDLFRDTRLKLRVLGQNDEKTTFLIYEEKALFSYLQSDCVREVLKTYGYCKMKGDDMLMEFAKRYQMYLQRKAKFPHEMGLFLEYPVEDVLGFIKHEGQGSLYTGYWKVYDKLEDKLSLFEQFNQAKERLIHLVYHRAFTLQEVF